MVQKFQEWNKMCGMYTYSVQLHSCIQDQNRPHLHLHALRHRPRMEGPIPIQDYIAPFLPPLLPLLLAISLRSQSHDSPCPIKHYFHKN